MLKALEKARVAQHVCAMTPMFNGVEGWIFRNADVIIHNTPTVDHGQPPTAFVLKVGNRHKYCIYEEFFAPLAFNDVLFILLHETLHQVMNHSQRVAELIRRECVLTIESRSYLAHIANIAADIIVNELLLTNFWNNGTESVFLNIFLSDEQKKFIEPKIGVEFLENMQPSKMLDQNWDPVSKKESHGCFLRTVQPIEDAVMAKYGSYEQFLKLVTLEDLSALIRKVLAKHENEVLSKLGMTREEFLKLIPTLSDSVTMAAQGSGQPFNIPSAAPSSKNSDTQEFQQRGGTGHGDQWSTFNSVRRGNWIRVFRDRFGKRIDWKAPEANWHHVPFRLQQFCASGNFHLPDYKPVEENVAPLKVLGWVDCSGSISDQTLEIFCALMKDLNQSKEVEGKYELDIWAFDTEPIEVKIEDENIVVQGGRGGTQIGCIHTKFGADYSPYDLIICCTDGQNATNFHTEHPEKWIVLLTENGTSQWFDEAEKIDFIPLGSCASQDEL